MIAATPARFRCSLELIEGAVGVSAVTPDCTIVTERMASRPGRHELDILVPEARAIGAILVRNFAMTGRRSRAAISAISMQACGADELPLLPRDRPGARLTLPLRCSPVRDDEGVPQVTTSDVEVDTAQAAVIVIDAWEKLGKRVERNITEKLAPTLAAMRSIGMTIVHSPHDEAIHPLARPLDGELVMPGEFTGTDYAATMFRDAGVIWLFYLGYYSNTCVVGRSLGLVEMKKRGFKIVLVRDASMARESAESAAEQWFHRAAVHMVELQGGATVSAAEFQAAIGSTRARRFG